MNELTTIERVKAIVTRRYGELTNKGLHYFADLPPEARREAVANALYLAWRQLESLAKKGRGDHDLVTSVFYFALRATRSGRTKRDSHFRDAYSGGRNPVGVDLDSYLSVATPIPDAVAFKVDTEDWLGSLTDQQRSRALELATGLTTTEAAEKWGVGEPAVSMARRSLNRSYEKYMM